ncbi:DUF4876 domain-containing protein [Alistipes sp.]|uniref:DUF4876 domain-containing protein n=1 Tax=Alistipes sp. TaxID=1872444 RepID=UPI0025C5479C|nr:DUF4876 domain-containing protein [Alistipes sp.]
MKKIFVLMIGILCSVVFFASCEKSDSEQARTFGVKVQLRYPEGSPIGVTEGVEVKLANTMGSIYTDLTDAEGVAIFDVPAGIYEASASETRALDGYSYIFNGIQSGITITDGWIGGGVVDLALTESKSGQLVIKELYVGGCPKDDDPSKTFAMDKYVILYNNSSSRLDLSNFCLGMVNPYNANSQTNDYVNGKLSYADLGYIPAGQAIWYLPKHMVIEPYSDVVVAMNGAIDHTKTYSQAVDLSSADYACYDIDVFSHTSYYPTPSEKIPTDCWFKAYKYGQGTGWALSQVSPAFFVFSTKGQSPVEFASGTDYHYTAGKEGNIVYACAKVPTDWILDGIEVFNTKYEGLNKKRLTPAVDAGYIMTSQGKSYSLYRNVNKEATEALPENKGKLVYGYAMGVENSTDPSGIDAEASIRNGARIIYMDTNNSTNDFHQRSRASIRQ